MTKTMGIRGAKPRVPQTTGLEIPEEFRPSRKILLPPPHLLTADIISHRLSPPPPALGGALNYHILNQDLSNGFFSAHGAV